MALVVGTRQPKSNPPWRTTGMHVVLGRGLNPYLRRHWRFAWHTGCRFHGVQLVDECPACKAPIEPHRLTAEDQHLAQCSRCHNDFRKAVCTSPLPEAFSVQVMADRVLEQDKVTFRQASIAPADWFSMVAFFIGVIRRASRRPVSPWPMRFFHWAFRLRIAECLCLAWRLSCWLSASVVPYW